MSANALVRWFNNTDRLLLIASIICSFIYFITPGSSAFTGRFVVKGAAVAFLAAIAWRLLRGRARYLLGAALVLSSAGDILLDLGERFFVYGLAAFLLAHICYGALFVLYWPRPFRPRADQWMLVAAVVIYAGALAWRIWPGLGAMRMRPPVLAYIIVITLMVVAAALARFVSQWVILGAVLFLISDSLIGLNRFHQPLSSFMVDYLIWLTYYLGQCGLALGFMRELWLEQRPVPEREPARKKRMTRKKRR